jgi:hypothetical protein
VKRHFGFSIFAVVVALGSRVALAQFAAPGLGPGGGGPANLTQQPGIVPGLGGGLGLAPGQTVRIALFCTDLFANTPDYRTRFTASGDGGQVQLASGRTIALRDALEDDLLVIRGRGPSDPPRQDGRVYIDAYVTNASAEPAHVELPGGLLLVPAGQRAPQVPARVGGMLAAAAAAQSLPGDAAAYAVWAATGSTRADVEQTLMRRVTDAEARQVQQLLDAAAMPRRFDREAESYNALYQQASADLGHATPLQGTASLSTGGRVQVEGLRAADGRALVTLRSPRTGATWRYTARVEGQRAGRISLALRHLKTGLPLEANGGHLWVTLRADERQARRE